MDYSDNNQLPRRQTKTLRIDLHHSASMGSTENVLGLQSPSKSLQALFRRKESMESSDMMSLGSDDHRNKSPSKAMMLALIPRLSPSKSPRSSVQVIQQEAPSPSHATVDDIAGTDESFKDYDLESIESILQVYEDPSANQPEQSFVFREHFDTSSNMSRQLSTTQNKTKGRKVPRLAIQQVLDLTDSGSSSAFFDARSSSNEPSGSGSGSGSSRHSKGIRSSSASISSMRSKRFTIYSDQQVVGQGLSQLIAARESKVLSTASTIDILNRSSMFNLTTISDMHQDSENVNNDALEQPLDTGPNNTIILGEKVLQRSVHSLSTDELLDKLAQRKSEYDTTHETSPSGRSIVRDLPIGIYEVKPKVQPRLVTIKTPAALDPVHYHDSDIASQNSVTSTEIVPEEVKMTGQPIPKQMGKRPPPKAPTHDRLSYENSHENMLRLNPRVVSDIPGMVPASLLSDYRSESDSIFTYDEKGYFEHTIEYFSWSFFIVLMTVGLLAPPIYFLIPLGIFDRLCTNKKNLFFGYDYDIFKPKVVRFSPVQKTISVVWGIFWFASIVAMIGVGFGLGTKSH